MSLGSLCCVSCAWLTSKCASKDFNLLMSVFEKCVQARTEMEVERRLEAMGEAERRSRFIRNRILSLCCPRCYQVFVDFQGYVFICMVSRVCVCVYVYVCVHRVR